MIQTCLERGVSRLVYTATADVVIGFDNIENGTEFLPYPDKFLYDGYGGTKARAEKLVRAANGRELSNGKCIYVTYIHKVTCWGSHINS